MKIKNILKEIGETLTVPPSSNFNVSKTSGSVTFNFSGLTYHVDIEVNNVRDNKISISADFGTAESDYGTTNQGQPLTVISFVFGCIDKWLKKYKTKFFKSESLNLMYLRYHPKSEPDEREYVNNKRDKLYRVFIEKWAKRYNSSVNFSTSGGYYTNINANFNPPMEYK
jgi:hypothetical protein